MTQKCTKCKESKDIESFSIEANSSNPNYRRKICKNCRSKQDKQRKKESDFYRIQYQSMTPEKRVEYIAKKSAENQRRFKTNPEALARKKLHDMSDSGIYSRYKGDCNRRSRLIRGVKMELSLEQFSEIINKSCHYCGVDNSRGCDRIDSLKSYTTENTQSCCKTCNQMKNDKTDDQFIEHIKKILKNRGF